MDVSVGGKGVHAFGPFRLDGTRRMLLRDGLPVHLPPRQFDTLLYLVENHGRVVEKDELLSAVWGGRIVEEGNLSQTVFALRRVLHGEEGARWIVTAPGRGYRFVGPVALGMDEVGPAAPATTAEATIRGHGLPRPATRLHGRETDIAAVLAALREDRLVTIAGPGGVGKTRLALEVAHRRSSDSRDGVCLIDLAVVADAALVPSAVASALGVGLRADAAPAELIIRRVKAQSPLLVLDNCEHVIDAAAALAEALLAAVPGLRILATSREPLACAGEQVYRLLPLALPAAGVRRAEAALDAPSVALLVERAHAADSRFALADEEAEAAGQICRRLDGLPLAIEMVGPWAATFGVGGLAARLEASFPLPAGSRRTAPPRQRSLEATLDWSHELLGDAERRVLRRLAVFAGAFPLSAAEAVASGADLPAAEVAGLLVGLVAKSLVTTVPGRPPTRYRLLETTRAYALEKLAAAGEVDALRDGHARHVVDRLRRAEAEWDVTADEAWDQRHGGLTDDLRAALAWASGEAGDRLLALALVGRSLQLWVATNLSVEGLRWAEAALGWLDDLTPVPLAAAVWLSFGGLIAGRSPERCIVALERAAALFGELPDPVGRAHALVGIGQSLAQYGETARAARALEEARRVLAPAGGTKRLALCAVGFGMLKAGEQRWGDARREYETAVTLLQGVGASRLLVMTLYNLADAIWSEGDLAAAAAAAREALVQARRTGGDGYVGGAAGLLAGILTGAGELDEALALAREALPLCHEDGYVAWLYDHLALRVGRAGRPADAARLSGYATRLHDGSRRQLNEQRALEALEAMVGASIGAEEARRLAQLGALLTEEQAMALALAPDR